MKGGYQLIDFGGYNFEYDGIYANHEFTPENELFHKICDKLKSNKEVIIGNLYIEGYEVTSVPLSVSNATSRDFKSIKFVGLINLEIGCVFISINYVKIFTSNVEYIMICITNKIDDL